jgi:two-component system sensor histidine kinase UhpB
MQDALAALERSVLATAEGARRLSHELHPATLRLLRLAAATRAHCLEVEKRHDVQVGFTAKGDFLDVDPDVALCVFRVAQEALRNAAVHGQARRLEVTLVRSTEHIELTVADDGRGFDVGDVRGDGRGLGLISMEERAQAAGGSLEITTRPGAGTHVVLRVPNLSVAMGDQDAPDLPGEPHCAREITS